MVLAWTPSVWAMWFVRRCREAINVGRCVVELFQVYGIKPSNSISGFRKADQEQRRGQGCLKVAEAQPTPALSSLRLAHCHPERGESSFAALRMRYRYPQVEYFAPSHRVIIWDVRGHGYS